MVFKLTEFVLLPQNILNLLVDSERSPKVGVLAPAPCYRTTVQTIHGLGAITIPYNLSEEDGWELRVEELHRALESAKGMCKPVAIYITNPGNPAGKPHTHAHLRVGTCVYVSVFSFSWGHFGFRSDSEQKIHARGDPVCL